MNLFAIALCSFIATVCNAFVPPTVKFMKSTLHMTTKSEEFQSYLKKSAGYLVAGLVVTSSPAFAFSPHPFKSITTPNNVKFDLSKADADAKLQFTCSNDIAKKSEALLTTTAFGPGRDIDDEDIAEFLTCETAGVEVNFQFPIKDPVTDKIVFEPKKNLINVLVKGVWNVNYKTDGEWVISKGIKKPIA